jgi:hypothetical protein
MKNLLKIGLLALLLPLYSVGQTITLQLPKGIVTEERLKSYGDSLVKVLSGNTKPIEPVDPVIPGKLDCPDGPIINRVFDVTPTTLQFQFHANGVYGIEFWVRDEKGNQVSHGLLADLKSNTQSVKYRALQPGTYQLSIAGSTCNSKVFTKVFQISGVGATDPPTGQPDQGEYIKLGVYHQKIGGRKYGYNKTPGFALSFEKAGTFTDVTPGLKDGEIDGKKVYYAIDNFPLEADGGGVALMKSLYLPDGIYTLQQYVCDPVKIPTFEHFKQGFAGWGNHGVNSDNARRSQIFLSIHSDEKQGNGTVPEWLETARVITYPKYYTRKNWRDYVKVQAIGDRNLFDNPADYHAAGVNTYYGNGDTGDALWRTNRMHSYYNPSNSELYSWGRGEWELMGKSPNSITTSEFVENTYGRDTTNIQERLVHYDKGFYDAQRENTGIADARKSNSFGDYGGDNWFGAFGSFLTAGFENFKLSLTDKLYGGYYPPENRWYTDKVIYYGSGSSDLKPIDYRNLNHKIYFENSIRYVPYDALYLNERVKLGTKTFEGKDRERNVILFTSPKVETFTMRPDGSKNGIEFTDAGEIIPYPGGEILTKVNHQPPAPWGEMYTSVLFFNFVGGGTLSWDAGGTFGGDSTKFDAWDGFEPSFSWRRTGEKEFRPYNPGQDGSPVKSNTGYINRLYSLPIDAQLAASEVAWKYRDKTTKISHVSYESNRGGYTAIPGTKGFHLNGFGEINREQYNSFHIFDKKKAISLIGEGSEGKCIIYYNGFLSHQLSEKVTMQGKTFEAYGRQLVIIDL